MTNWNVKTANKFLRSIEKQASVNAEKFVNEHALEIAQLFIDETKDNKKPWPQGSMTVGKINKSQALTDLFVRVTDSHRSDTIRDVKFVYENFDAIQNFIINEKKGKWISVTNIRKAFADKDRASKDTTEDKPSKDTAKDTTEDTTETSDDTTTEPVTLEMLSMDWMAMRTEFANKVRDAGFTMEEFKEYEKAKIAGFSNKKVA